MSTSTRPTLKSTNARIDSVEAKLDAILAHLEAKTPAKTVRKAPAKKAPAKKAQPKAVAPVKVLSLCKATRVRFIAAAQAEGNDFQGMSTKAIAAMCVEAPALVPAGFAIGEGYKALFA